MTQTETPPAAETVAAVPWQAVLCIEGQPTGDGRIVLPGALSWRDLPRPLMFQRETPAGGLGGNPHAGAVIAGRIDRIWRDGSKIMGEGYFDTGADGVELARMTTDRTIRGVSVDLDEVSGEVTEDAPNGAFSEARIMGATCCPFEAIVGAEIWIATEALATQADGQPDVPPHEYVDSGDGTCEKCGQPASDPIHDGGAQAGVHLPADVLVAAGGPLLPPEAWFQDPDLPGPTPLTIADDGRVFGHAFLWDTPHRALPGRTPPHSPSGYSHFTTGSRRAACDCPDRGGQVEIPTGVITLGTSHASPSRTVSPREAVSHYEQTGLAAADVAMGEDEHGGWVAGALRPGVSDERLIELRGASLSGDWRFIGGRLDLVAILAVNTPGFPVPRTAFHVEQGRETALVAAGVVLPDDLDGWETRELVAALAHRLAQAEARIAYLEPIGRALSSTARAALIERLGL